MKEVKYTPKDKIQLLNRIAFKNKKNCLNDCPIMIGEWNVPIILAHPRKGAEETFEFTEGKANGIARICRLYGTKSFSSGH